MAANPETPRNTRAGICHGPRCRDYGGADLLAGLQAEGIDAEAIDCQSLCPHSPVVRLPSRCLLRATLDELRQAMNG